MKNKDKCKMYIFGRKVQPKNHELISYYDAMDIITSDRNLIARSISCMDLLEGVINHKGKLVWFPMFDETNPFSFLAVDEMIDSSWEILDIKEFEAEITRQAWSFKAE